MSQCNLASRLTLFRSADAKRRQRRLPSRCAARHSCCPTSGGTPNSSPEGRPQLSRRAALFTAAGIALWSQTAAAETAVADAAPADTAAADTVTAPAPARKGSLPGFRTFNEKDFVLEVPRSYKEVQDKASSEFGAGGRPKSTYERIASLTPLRVKFTSEDGRELLTVIQRNASELKQTFLQVTDIAQLGSVSEVASILLPREVQVVAADSVTIPQEPRDTGTVFGTLQLPPQTIYRYTFRTRGQRAHLVVVAKAGKVYLTAGSTTEDRWADASDRLKAAVVSFRLV